MVEKFMVARDKSVHPYLLLSTWYSEHGCRIQVLDQDC